MFPYHTIQFKQFLVRSSFSTSVIKNPFSLSMSKKFKDVPFTYHQELKIKISNVTNLGVGVGRVTLGNHFNINLLFWSFFLV